MSRPITQGKFGLSVPSDRARPERGATGWLCLALIIAAFTSACLKFSATGADGQFAAHPLPSSGQIKSNAPALYRESFVSNGTTPSTHSATAVEDAKGNIRAFWYGGSREGGRDTAIYTSLQTESGWGPEQIAIDRHAVQRQLGRYIAKLGNPVVTRDARGRLWLFFVSVSIGGWSGSAINVVVSDDDGHTWGKVRRLVTSPFFNISTLVKAPPVYFTDNTIGLPVYHEFLGKFGEVLRIDVDGNVIAKTRLSWGRDSLQPAIVALSQNEAVGFMRYCGEAPPRLLMFRSNNGGDDWGEPAKLGLPNPNSAVAALGLQDGSLLLAFNDSESSRSVLSLAHSRDAGKSWHVIHSFERALADAVDQNKHEFSYPWLMQGASGDFHVFYTWSRKRIKHVRFNAAWLKQRL